MTQFERAAIIVELKTLAQYFRSGAINPDDARDECARTIENRIRYWESEMRARYIPGDV